MNSSHQPFSIDQGRFTDRQLGFVGIARKKDQRWKTEGTTFLQFNLNGLNPLEMGSQFFSKVQKLLKSKNKVFSGQALIQKQS